MLENNYAVAAVGCGVVSPTCTMDSNHEAANKQGHPPRGRPEEDCSSACKTGFLDFGKGLTASLLLC